MPTTGSATLIEMGYRGFHTSHGFRALGMGITKQKLGYRHEVPNKQLAREPETDVDRAYDRADFMSERIEMIQRLADYIDGLKHLKLSRFYGIETAQLKYHYGSAKGGGTACS